MAANEDAAASDPEGWEAGRRDLDSNEAMAHLAEDRTDWAMERTLLAKQRTFTAWLRTGMAAVAVGFGAARLLGEFSPTWMIQAGSALLVVAGAAIFVLGYRGYRTTFEKLAREGVTGISTLMIASVTGALLIGTALLLVGIFR
jgi:putative membrane protein